MWLIEILALLYNNVFLFLLWTKTHQHIRRMMFPDISKSAPDSFLFSCKFSPCYPFFICYCKTANYRISESRLYYCWKVIRCKLCVRKYQSRKIVSFGVAEWNMFQNSLGFSVNSCTRFLIKIYRFSKSQNFLLSSFFYSVA